jgi:ABC-2 type transport system ATP-binding protein
MNEAAIEATDLVREFKKGPRAVDGIELRVEPGEVYGFLGPNGAGKSTTVHMLTTLLPPTSGTARVAGHDVVEDGPAVRASIGAALQEAALDPFLTGREHMKLQGALHGMRGQEGRERTATLLERVGLSQAADRRVGGYSGGMKRRLDLAMSLVSEPKVVVLDEPTTGLDPRSRRDVWEAVSELARGGATVLLTTQYLEEADLLADRIAVIDHGRVVAEGSADELKARFGSETVELFFEDLAALGAAGIDGVAEPDRLCLRVPSDGSAEGVRRLLDEVDGVQRIALHRPSLDDVFLSLTERV